jgi:hypothetical protein
LFKAIAAAIALAVGVTIAQAPIANASTQYLRPKVNCYFDSTHWTPVQHILNNSTSTYRRISWVGMGTGTVNGGNSEDIDQMQVFQIRPDGSHVGTGQYFFFDYRPTVGYDTNTNSVSLPWGNVANVDIWLRKHSTLKWCKVRQYA